MRRRVFEQRLRLQSEMDRYLDALRERLTYCEPGRLLARLGDRLQQQSLYVDERRQDLYAALDWLVRLDDLSPLTGLGRGFALAEKNGTPVRDGADLEPGDLLHLRFHRGGAICSVQETIDE